LLGFKVRVSDLGFKVRVSVSNMTSIAPRKLHALIPVVPALRQREV